MKASKPSIGLSSTKALNNKRSSTGSWRIVETFSNIVLVLHLLLNDGPIIALFARSYTSRTQLTLEGFSTLSLWKKNNRTSLVLVLAILDIRRSVVRRVEIFNNLVNGNNGRTIVIVILEVLRRLCPHTVISDVRSLAYGGSLKDEGRDVVNMRHFDCCGGYWRIQGVAVGEFGVFLVDAFDSDV